MGTVQIIKIERFLLSGSQKGRFGTVNHLLWKIVNQKPTEDLLIAIPAASLNRQEDKNLDNGKQK